MNYKALLLATANNNKQKIKVSNLFKRKSDLSEKKRCEDKKIEEVEEEEIGTPIVYEKSHRRSPSVRRRHGMAEKYEVERYEIKDKLVYMLRIENAKEHGFFWFASFVRVRNLCLILVKDCLWNFVNEKHI